MNGQQTRKDWTSRGMYKVMLKNHDRERVIDPDRLTNIMGRIRDNKTRKINYSGVSLDDQPFGDEALKLDDIRTYNFQSYASAPRNPLEYAMRQRTATRTLINQEDRSNLSPNQLLSRDLATISHNIALISTIPTDDFEISDADLIAVGLDPSKYSKEDRTAILVAQKNLALEEDLYRLNTTVLAATDKGVGLSPQDRNFVDRAVLAIGLDRVEIPESAGEFTRSNVERQIQSEEFSNNLRSALESSPLSSRLDGLQNYIRDNEAVVEHRAEREASNRASQVQSAPGLSDEDVRISRSASQVDKSTEAIMQTPFKPISKRLDKPSFLKASRPSGGILSVSEIHKGSKTASGAESFNADNDVEIEFD